MDPIFIAIAALIIGLVVGVVGGRMTAGQTVRQRRLAQQLDQLQTEHTRYQAEVNEHFLDTANLFRRLNDDYRNLHEHLAKGANRLCSNIECSEQLEKARNNNRLGHDDEADGAEPPRDYAPKSSDRDKGTLSEDYGFDAETESGERSNP